MKSAISADSQIPRRGPLVWMMPLNLHVNQKSVYDMMMIQQFSSIFYPVNMNHFSCKHTFQPERRKQHWILMKWPEPHKPGSTVFSKHNMSGFSVKRVKPLCRLELK